MLVLTTRCFVRYLAWYHPRLGVDRTGADRVRSFGVKSYRGEEAALDEYSRARIETSYLY